jgi:hypothetical protein
MRMADLRRLLAGALDSEQWEVEGLLSRLTPVLVVQTLESGEEGSWPRHAMGQSDLAAVPAELGISHLQNPTGSGVVVEVSDVWINGGANGDLLLGFSEAQLPTASPVSLLNRYLGSVAAPGLPSAIVTQDTAAATGIAAGDVLYMQTALANTVQHLELGGRVVLQPGTGIRACFNISNQNFRASWIWRELRAK